MPQQSLVQQWLAAIGLAPEILETFEAAGIVNPKDLAELQICHYPALGVQQPGDRKKLFYLVQRVKLAVPEEDKNGGVGTDGATGADEGNDDQENDLKDIINFNSVNAKNIVGSRSNTTNDKVNGTNNSRSDTWQQTRNKAAENGRRNGRQRQSQREHEQQQDQQDDDGYTSNFDTEEEEDGIDAALQEQYKPLLSPSSASINELLSEDQSDDSSSDEEIPSPPRNIDKRSNATSTSPNKHRQQQSDLEFSDDLDTSFETIDQQSPYRNKREEAFLTRRNARLAKIASPNKKKIDTNSTNNATTDNNAAKRTSTSSRMKLRSSKSNDDKDSNRSKTASSSSQSLPTSKSSLNKSYSSTATSASTRRRGRSANTTLQREKASSLSSSTAATANDELNTSTTSAMRRTSFREGSKRLNSSSSSSRTGSTASERNVNEGKTASARRASKRLLEKQARERLNLNSKNSKNPRSSSLSSDDQESSITQLSGSTTTSKVRSKKSSVSSSNDENDLDSILDDHVFPVSPDSGGGSDSSSNARSRSKASKGVLNQPKRLATIPSGRIMHNSSSSLHHDVRKDDDLLLPTDESVPVTSRKQTMRKSTSINIASGIQKSSQDINGGRAKSTPRSRENMSHLNISRSLTNVDLELNPVQSTEINENIDTTSNGQQRRKSVKTNATSNGTVFVHGKRKKESWTSMVESLRETNEQSYQDQLKVEPLDSESTEEMRIRVVVRKRPMSRKEAAHADDADVIHPLKYNGYGRILAYQPKTRVDLTREVETLPFAFDNVFPEDSNNCDIYDDTIKNLIPGAFEGRWACVFAYGQTGSGKTFTMMGSTLTGIKARNRNVKHEKNYGLYLLAARDLFMFARREEYSHFTIGASLFEIYGGKLFDLLNDRTSVKCLENHQGRVCFPGLSEHVISSAEDLMKLIEKGASNRSTGSTSANRDSSRSHAVLQLHLRKANGSNVDEEHGRLTFIDLAGSERGADNDKASRTTRLEGAEINVSLLALKEVIRALATGDAMTHIPFRGSKLTQVLKESFVGKNSRTVMVACVAPNMTNCDHTLNTLRYADRVKERNSETGKLSESVEAASKITATRPLTAPPAGFDLSRNQSKASFAKAEDDILQSCDDKWLSDLDNDDGPDLNDDDDMLKVSMDELNEVLKTPVHETVKSFTFEEEDQEDLLLRHHVTKLSSKAKSKKEAVAPLINSHRSIMSEMLSMVKQEMTLVNCTDEDRALIDDYLQELEQIQDKQLGMISTLRESLVQYYGQRPPADELDDSFDALLS